MTTPSCSHRRLLHPGKPLGATIRPMPGPPPPLPDDNASPAPFLPDPEAASHALEAWLATSTVDEVVAYYRAEGRLWPEKEA